MAKASDILSQTKTMWDRLTVGQRVGFFSVILAIGGGVAFSAWWASRPDWQLLTSGLSTRETGRITAKLEESGIRYTLKDGDKILVDAAQLDEAYRFLTEAGISAKGGADDETETSGLLKSAMDKNERAFAQARQIEKRLASRLTQFDFIESAAVTITPAADRYFRQGQSEAKASVQVKPTMPLSEHQIESIVHLVAGGVEKLSPDSVAVVDTNGIVLRQPMRGDNPAARTPDLSRQVAVEKHKESQAQQKLDLVFGPRKVAVTVSAEIDWDRVENREVKIDPENFGIVEKQTTANTKGGQGGGIGRPSNAALANGSAQGGGSSGADSKENLNKETRKYGTVETEMVKIGGAIKRISVGVFVDQSLSEQVEKIKTTIGAAVGLDPKRGDTIEVAMTSFVAPPEDNTLELKESAEKKTMIFAYAKQGFWVVMSAALVFMAWRTLRKAQRSLHDVLTKSAEEEKKEDKPVPIEETILTAVKADTELAGRSLRRWLYENAKA